MVSKICGTIFDKCTQEGAFLEFDKNYTGKISYQNFLEGMKKLNVGLSENQIYDLMISADEDGDGYIDYNEFTKRFNVKILKGKEMSEKLLDLARKIREKFSTLEEAFQSWRNVSHHKQSMNNVHGLRFIEFRNALKELEMEMEMNEVRKLFQSLDTNEDGHIDFAEFEKAFSVEDEKSDSWALEVLEDVVSLFHKSRFQLKRIFRSIDTDNSGSLDEKEFGIIMHAVNFLLGNPMSNLQVSKLFKVFDVNGDGSIDYNEFVSTLEVVDIQKLKEDEYRKVRWAVNPTSISSPRWIFFPPSVSFKLEKAFQSNKLENSSTSNRLSNNITPSFLNSNKRFSISLNEHFSVQCDSLNFFWLTSSEDDNFKLAVKRISEIEDVSSLTSPLPSSSSSPIMFATTSKISSPLFYQTPSTPLSPTASLSSPGRKKTLEFLTEIHKINKLSHENKRASKDTSLSDRLSRSEDFNGESNNTKSRDSSSKKVFPLKLHRRSSSLDMIEEKMREDKDVELN